MHVHGIEMMVKIWAKFVFLGKFFLQTFIIWQNYLRDSEKKNIKAHSEVFLGSNVNWDELFDYSALEIILSKTFCQDFKTAFDLPL